MNKIFDNSNMTAAEVERYVPAWIKYLVDKWGLNNDFAKKLARLIVWAGVYGFQADITSGYRSPEYQAELIREYQAGNPNIITPLPPGKSLHNKSNWYGRPDSLACDIVFNRDNRNYNAIYLARQLGLVAAGEPDFVHFAARSGTL